MLAFIPYLFSVISLLVTLYLVFRKEGQEDKQATALRLSKIEIEQANQLARQQGFQAEIEGVADHGRRERLAIVESAARDHAAIREMIKDVPTMRELVYRMVERLENTSKAMDKLDGKMDRIVELLTHK